MINTTDIQSAKSAGWITEDEFEHPTNTICGRELCSILFQYLPEDIKYYVDEGREVWIVKQLGLIEPSIQSKESITRMEFAESLYALLTLDVCSVSLCEANILPIYYTEMESRAYVQSWLDDIPYQIRQRFLTDGWELYIGDGFLKDGFYEIYGEASGLTREQDKIMVATRDGQYSSILHEFGHFLHITNGYDPEFDAIYQRESGASGFSKHHRSSWREYYAQSFSYYVSGMKANFTACPETYVYFDNLRKSGWIT